MTAAQTDLFAVRVLPPELVYEEEFLSRAEETALLEEISRLPLEEAQYKAYTARRRIVSFGAEYDFARNRLDEGPPIPDFLLPLREKVAQRTGIAAESFGHALVTEYRPGTPLGWHRDVPEFEVVVGVSLGSACRMRFRRYPHEKHSKEKPIDVLLEPRSIYLMKGESRWGWQHSVPPTPALRHSVTFRTRRGVTMPTTG
jgi:alkylated DNA repair dioxygenase AlkB